MHMLAALPSLASMICRKWRSRTRKRREEKERGLIMPWGATHLGTRMGTVGAAH